MRDGGEAVIAHGFNTERYLRSVERLSCSEAERREQAEIAWLLRAQLRQRRQIEVVRRVVLMFGAALLMVALLIL